MKGPGNGEPGSSFFAPGRPGHDPPLHPPRPRVLPSVLLAASLADPSRPDNRRPVDIHAVDSSGWARHNRMAAAATGEGLPGGLKSRWTYAVYNRDGRELRRRIRRGAKCDDGREEPVNPRADASSGYGRSQVFAIPW